MEEKVYKPEVITDQPFPADTSTVPQTVTESSSGGVSKPAEIQNKPFKQRLIAQETIASSFNTLTKKITGVFEFLKMGAIKIGEYVNGVSGEIKISPDGIVARNKAGLETFAIDGDTGDATFRGTVRAGDVQVIDENGLISLASFLSDTVSFAYPTTYTTASSSPVDIPTMTLSVTLLRQSKILILVSIQGANQDATYTNAYGAYIDLVVDDIRVDTGSIAGIPYQGSGTINNINWATNYITSLAEGEHTIKLQFCTSYLGGHAYVARGSLSYVTLGR